MSWRQIEFNNTGNITFFIIPVLIILIMEMGYRKKEDILKRLNIEYKKGHKAFQFILITFGIIFIIFSLLGPQVFMGYQEVEKEGLDIYILFDTSKSMLAEDVKPNRLEFSKNIVEKLLNSLEGDRIGFIPFSSDAYIQMPLTDDYELARMFLKVIDTDMIAGGGTNIASAINLASSSFMRSAEGDKVILIISDGEEHDNISLDTVREISDENIKVYTIGVGTEKGGLIPVSDAEGRVVAYKQDQSGEYVITRLHSRTLKKLAETGQGSYFQANVSGRGIDSFIAKILSLKRSQYETEKIKKYTQLYQYFLGPGLFLFITGYLLLRGERINEK